MYHRRPAKLQCIALSLGIAIASSLLLPVSAMGKTLLVGLRGSGPFAVEHCAQDLMQHQRPFASATAGGSRSLDELHRQHGVRGYRALFRPPETGRAAPAARAFAEQLRARSPKGRSRSTSRPGDHLNRGGGATGPDQRGSSLESLFHVYRVELSAETDPSRALEAYRRDPHVAFAQLDHETTVDQDFTDPLLYSSGAWGQSYRDMWGLVTTRVFEAWEETLGEDIVVGVVDTGIDDEHPDLQGQLWINEGEDLDGDGRASASDLNGLDDDGNGFIDDLTGYDFAGYSQDLLDGVSPPGNRDPYDLRGHGTHVAGTIGAAANGQGIVGVAPGVTLLPVKVFPEAGSAKTSDVWAGVLYAANNGARIVNGSFSCGSPCPENPLARLVMGALEELGVLFVTSAGNAGADVLHFSPENTRYAITVGSHGVVDVRSDSSNSGWLMDLLAPGGGPAPPGSDPFSSRNIVSLRAASDVSDERLVVEEEYVRKSGTSMAAPHVTGALALLLAHRPEVDAERARRLLRMSARPIGAPGHDPSAGAGALDAAALLSEPPSSVLLEIESPSPGSVIDPLTTPLVTIRGRAAGERLRRVEVAVASGIEGRSFETVSTAEPPPASQDLAQWPVSAVANGPYVVRLRGELMDGRIIDEFTIVGIERTAPLRLSDSTTEAGGPAISRGRVYWLEQVDGDAPESTPIGRVWTARFPDPRHSDRPLESYLLAEREGLLETLQADGRRVVWSRTLAHEDQDDLDVRFEGCLLSGKSRQPCAPAEYRRSSVAPLSFRFAGRRLFWTPRGDGFARTLGCLLVGRRSCRMQDIAALAAPESSSRLLDFDGRSLVWLDRSATAPPRAQLCRLGRPGSIRTPAPECAPVIVTFGGTPLAPESAGIDGNLLALSLPSSAFASQLGYCEVDLATGDCPARLAGDIVPGTEPVVSGRRIVWLEPRPDSMPAAVFCEVDEVDGGCLVQRLAGAPARQSSPAIDGRWIVWEDHRRDTAAIMGVEAPEVSPLGTIETTGGTWAKRTFSLAGVAVDDASIRLEAVSIEDSDAWAPAVRVDRNGRGLLELRPPRSARGEFTWRLVVRSNRGLETSRRLDVVVKPPGWTRHEIRGGLNASE